MLINAQLLLQFQRCQRRPFLDVHGDYLQREIPNELVLKVQQDKIASSSANSQKVKLLRT